MITPRPLRIDTAALPADWHPLVKNIYAGRLSHHDEIEKRLQHLLPPDNLTGLNAALDRLDRAIRHREPILVYGDYDVDGATATALTVRVLRQLGADVTWFIPNRSVHGYGFSLAGLADLPGAPRLILTVDNGIQSHDAIAAARVRGIDVVVTDHHLPGETLPPANAIVNPNRRDCPFAGKHLAGVGVAFYLLLALRSRLLAENRWPDTLRLSDYLDLVALGTVADLVPLDYNNRILVNHGLARIRSGHANTGINALMAVANLDPARLTAQDIAFSLAPRLNALGRLGDMADGVALLLAEDRQTALDYAQQCDDLNRDRKALENEAVQ